MKRKNTTDIAAVPICRSLKMSISKRDRRHVRSLIPIPVITTDETTALTDYRRLNPAPASRIDTRALALQP